MAYENNLVLDLNFDLPAGTTTVTDSSPSQANGNVVNCAFVAGEGGHNCIQFDGQGYVEISENVIPVAEDFTLLARLKYKPLGSGTKFGFSATVGTSASNEVWLAIPADTWGDLAVVKEDLTLRIYWDAELLETVYLPAQPSGFAFLQDILSTEYGVGNIATAKAYNVAIPIEAEPEPGDPVYQIAVQPTALSFTAAGQTKSFVATATKDGQPAAVEVVSKPAWATATTSSVTAQANAGGARTGSVVLRPVSGDVSASIALSQAAATGTNPDPVTPTPTLEYYIDGTNFKAWDIYVSESNGLLDRPKLKAPLKIDWDDYHGEVVDLRDKRVEAREITLNCFIHANGKLDFITKLNTFLNVFQKNGTQRLTVEIDPEKPLIYEVYNESGVSIAKRWNDDIMVGTFSLKLKEPEPVKRIVKFTRTGTATTHIITLSSNKTVSIYWGDGTKTEDVYGTNVTVTHTYASNGDYFTEVAGVIEDVKDFSTNGTIVWNKL